MRLVGAAIALALALSPTTSSAQAPPASSWRSAARAALAFGHAEGQVADLRRFTISAAPQTKRAADAALDELDRHAHQARKAFASVQRYGSPFWTAAAQVRIGDTFACQADKIATIPIPPQLTSAAQRLPPNVLAQYLEVLHGLVQPLRDQAERQWERAAADPASGFVAGLARQRLAGITVPDC